jgi:hypothetical protein
MSFIRRVKTKSGATAIQIAHKVYGKIKRIDHIGSAHNSAELELLLGLARQRLHQGQLSLFDSQPSQITIGLQESASTLLRDILLEQYQCLGFGCFNDPDFAYLCIARLVEPVSKLDSLRVLADMGVSGVDKNRLYRCLNRVVNQRYRDTISRMCFTKAQNRGITLVLYDVTTLYFEIQKEDEYRKPGLSKERRLEPQIVLGLLVDQTGFPIELHSFEGNRAEVKTILPVIEAFKTRNQLNEITIVADAAMLSAKNLEEITAAGYTYIVGSRLNKIPYDIAEYQKTAPLSDNQIITTTINQEKRIIYQYKEKRAILDRSNLEKQIAKAKRVVSGQVPASRAKFVTVKSKGKSLNQLLIDKAQALVGIKGYVTNTPLSDKKVIDYYHQLWHVEQTFRMSKSDLKARPIFHRKKDAIEAHLTIIMATLAIGKNIESLSGMSLKQVIKMLRPIRSGTVVISGKAYEAAAVIPPSIQCIVDKLRARDTN